jgi:hypothetical protein
MLIHFSLACQAYHKYKPSSTHYSITIVADMDKASKTVPPLPLPHSRALMREN